LPFFLFSIAFSQDKSWGIMNRNLAVTLKSASFQLITGNEIRISNKDSYKTIERMDIIFNTIYVINPYISAGIGGKFFSTLTAFYVRPGTFLKLKTFYGNKKHVISYRALYDYTNNFHQNFYWRFRHQIQNLFFVKNSTQKISYIKGYYELLLPHGNSKTKLEHRINFSLGYRVEKKRWEAGYELRIPQTRNHKNSFHHWLLLLFYLA
jgi:hypothetical protein